MTPDWNGRCRVLVVLVLIVSIVVGVLAWRGLGENRPDAATEGPEAGGAAAVSSAAVAPPGPMHPAYAGSTLTPVGGQHAHKAVVSTGGPLPPEGTPWSELVAALGERAQAGDKAASDRLYNDTLGCIRYSLAVPVARARLRRDSNVDSLSVAQMAHALRGYESLSAVLRDNEAACSDVTRDEVYRDVYSIFLAAGRNGNENAAVCYASAPYDAVPGGQTGDNEAALAQWADNALALLQAGVRRGDWMMVYLLRSYFDPLSRKLVTSYHNSWEVYQFQPDPLRAYRYAQLMAIGARADGSDKDRDRARGLVSELEQEHRFTDAQIRQAQQWARQTYRQYFIGKPWTIGGDSLSLCQYGR